MTPQAPSLTDHLRALAEDADAFMSATADVAGDKVSEVRQRLAASVERGAAMLHDLKDKAVEGAKAAEQTVRLHPYQTVGIALSLGTILGYFLTHRCCQKNA